MLRWNTLFEYACFIQLRVIGRWSDISFSSIVRMFAVRLHL